MIINFVPSRAAMIGYINENYPVHIERLDEFTDGGIESLWMMCVMVEILSDHDNSRDWWVDANLCNRT